MPEFFPSGTHEPSTYKYVTIADIGTGTDADLWDPTVGKRLHLTSIIVSVDVAGQVEIRDKTADVIIGVMNFNTMKATPFNFGTDLQLPVSHVLEAKFTADSAAGNAHITVIGHVH